MNLKRLYADIYMFVVAIVITAFIIYNCSKIDDYTLDDFIYDLCVKDNECLKIDIDQCINDIKVSRDKIYDSITKNEIIYNEDAAKQCIQLINDFSCNRLRINIPGVCDQVFIENNPNKGIM
jgi:hypothetical protein